jgi:hypothetical protein
VAAISRASLRAAHPEWEQAPDTVLNPVVARANDLSLLADLWSDSEDTYRRHLEASALLYLSPFARDMHRPDSAARNPYREQAREMDRAKGAIWRVPWRDL